MPVLRRAVMAFADHPAVNRVRVVVADGQIEDAYRAVGGGFGNVEPIIGGATRGESVRNGLPLFGRDSVLSPHSPPPFCPPRVDRRFGPPPAFFLRAVPGLPIK